jgi:hypothetical protein
MNQKTSNTFSIYTKNIHMELYTLPHYRSGDTTSAPVSLIPGDGDFDDQPRIPKRKTSPSEVKPVNWKENWRQCQPPAITPRSLQPEQATWQNMRYLDLKSLHVKYSKRCRDTDTDPVQFATFSDIIYKSEKTRTSQLTMDTLLETILGPHIEHSPKKYT